MTKLIITGGNSLKGTVRLGGAKNSSFKLMIASLLAKGESRLLNFSKISDINVTKNIIEALGGSVRTCGERSLYVNASKITLSRIPEELGLASRASTMFIGPLLYRLKKAVVPLPGGDKIGKRPLDRHFKGLEQLGAKIWIKKNMIEVSAQNLKGAHIIFPKNTHTGTETLLMAAVFADGKTILENAASEPEVDDMINFLNKMGAKIKRVKPKTIIIQGVKAFNPVIYKVMPDRNEAVSYAIAAYISKGDIIVENARVEHLQAFLKKLNDINAKYEIGNYGIRFYYQNDMKATDIVTASHPGFMTDWQPLWSILATQCFGVSSIIESVHLNRFQYVKYLLKMDAKIEYFKPKIDNPDAFYNFNLKDDNSNFYHGIKITGPSELKAIKAKVVDLRAGATLVLAALIAKGKTILEDVEHIDRGYENLDSRLRDLGAKITRI